MGTNKLKTEVIMSRLRIDISIHCRKRGEAAAGRCKIYTLKDALENIKNRRQEKYKKLYAKRWMICAMTAKMNFSDEVVMKTVLEMKLKSQQHLCYGPWNYLISILLLSREYRNMMTKVSKK